MTDDARTDRNIVLNEHHHLTAFVEAGLAVVRMLEGNTDSLGFASHLTYSEADDLANLAHMAGRDDLAQEFMLAWADGDEDAGEFETDLNEWGIAVAGDATENPKVDPDGDAWQIVGEVGR